jgi:type II secretory pathway component PulF
MTSLEELIAFNDEVASLTHAGVPIDLGLSQLSRDPDIANKQINAALTRRVQNGVLLADAISEEDQLLPPIYQSVVAAGLRCGSLPAALETLSRHTQSLLDLRQSLRSALAYPLIVCGLAYLLFVGSCLFVPPEYYHQLADMGSGSAVSDVVQMLRDSLPFWVAIPPVLLTGVLFVEFRSNSSRTMWSRGIPSGFRWLPGVSRVTADQRWASLAELLALLVEHEVPLPEGLRLAARVSGDRKLTSAAQQMASAAEQGRSLTQDAHAVRQFPPFLHWALTSTTEASGLARTLRLAAKTYRQRAQRQTKRLRVVMPMLTCFVLAGGVTLLYCLSVFVPLVRLVEDLS